MIDTSLPAVQLVQKGMEAEVQGRRAEARELFLQAWSICSSDYEHCITAHYAAKHAESPEERIKWDQLAIDHAEKADQDSVKPFYASLYASLGQGFEWAGDLDKASDSYRQGKECVGDIPEGEYRKMVGKIIDEALARVAGD